MSLAMKSRNLDTAPFWTEDDELRISVANMLLEPNREWTPYQDIARQIVQEGFAKSALDTLLRLWLDEGTAQRRTEGGGSLWRYGWEGEKR